MDALSIFFYTDVVEIMWLGIGKYSNIYLYFIRSMIFFYRYHKIIIIYSKLAPQARGKPGPSKELDFKMQASL